MRCDEDLLAAYVDGVTELSADERRRVEARLDAPAARAEADAVRELVGELRDAGVRERAEHAPDWAALERSIRDAVPTAAPRAWWHRVRWSVPGLAAAAAAVALLVTFVRPPDTQPSLAVVPAAPAAVAAERIDPRAATVALYLDGTELELELDDFELEAALDDPFQGLDDPGLVDEFLAPTDLAWVDELDDDDLEHAERWLAGGGRG